MNKKHPKYNSYLENLRTNPSAGDGDWEYVETESGGCLFMQNWFADVPADRVLLCLHGMNSHGQYYALLADNLAGTGTAVYAPDLPGHGLSCWKRGDMPGRETLIRTVKTCMDYVRGRHPGKKVFLLGDSMGGLAAVNFALEFPGLVDGLILSAPALMFNFNPQPEHLFAFLPGLAGLMFFPELPFIRTSGREELVTRHEETLRHEQNDPLHLYSVSPGYMKTIVGMIINAWRIGPEKINTPTLVFQGGRDAAVSAGAVKRFFSRMKSRDRELIYYPEAFHCLITDPDASDMHARMTRWMEERT